jgi:hypothetical protein
MSKTPKPTETLPNRLDAALLKALEAYEAFVAETPPSDPKAFATFQAGCKAALAHLEALVKLANLVTPGDPATDPMAASQRALRAEMVRDARVAVSRLGID